MAQPVETAAVRRGSRAMSDRDAILALVQQWREATTARDIPKLLAMVTEDIVFLPGTIPPVRGKAAVEELYRSAFAQYRQIEQLAAVEEVQIAGDWAFLWGTDELRLQPESGPLVHMKGKGLSVLKRQADGTWKFWRGINNMTVRKPAASV